MKKLLSSLFGWTSLWAVWVLIGIVASFESIGIAAFCSEIFDWKFSVVGWVAFILIGVFDSAPMHLVGLVTCIADIFIFWDDGGKEFWCPVIFLLCCLIPFLISFVIHVLAKQALVEQKEGMEKLQEKKKITPKYTNEDRRKGERITAVLDIFFDARVFGEMLLKRKFYAGPGNRIYIKYEVVNVETVEDCVKTVRAIEEITQQWFDTNFDLPQEFGEAALKTINKLEERKKYTDARECAAIQKQLVQFFKEKHYRLTHEELEFSYKQLFVVQLIKGKENIYEYSFRIMPPKKSK